LAVSQKRMVNNIHTPTRRIRISDTNAGVFNGIEILGVDKDFRYDNGLHTGTVSLAGFSQPVIFDIGIKIAYI
jgi:hypothetical protein